MLDTTEAMTSVVLFVPPVTMPMVMAAEKVSTSAADIIISISSESFKPRRCFVFFLLKKFNNPFPPVRPAAPLCSPAL